MIAAPALLAVAGVWLVLQAVAGELGPRILSWRSGVSIPRGGVDPVTAGATTVASAALGALPGGATGSSGSVGSSRPPSEMVSWGGATLHHTVMPRFRAMIEAAAHDGVKLTPGSTYRSREAQIALRKAHCGAGWATAPASSCSPPTALPGSSRHERGEAIDFANLSGAGFSWLKANAARFGFYNLPSERWHWSVDGH